MRGLATISLISLWHRLATVQTADAAVPSATCTFVCNPATDCPGCGAGSLVPDPADCESYYICLETPTGDVVPSASSLACPTDYYFSVAVGSCIEETTPGECVADDGCSGVLPTTTASSVSRCNSTCPTDGSIASIADVHNCSSYYICVDSNPAIHSSCPVETPYFNGDICVSDESQCCDFCTPYCPKNLTEIQDPCDCTSYYICVYEGSVDDANRFSCAGGQYFDENSLTCVDGSCINICNTCPTSAPPTQTSAPPTSTSAPTRETTPSTLTSIPTTLTSTQTTPTSAPTTQTTPTSAPTTQTTRTSAPSTQTSAPMTQTTPTSAPTTPMSTSEIPTSVTTLATSTLTSTVTTSTTAQMTRTYSVPPSVTTTYDASGGRQFLSMEEQNQHRAAKVVRL